jgi:general secretion pathway protein F
MPAFHYTALNQQNKTQKGIIEADNNKQARQLLRDQGLLPVETQLAHQKKTKNSLFREKNLTPKELSLITRQLSTLLTAGMPLAEVITAVAEQTEKSHAKSLLLSIRGKIVAGYSLASALNHFPQAFSNLYCSTIAAGEKSGHLDIVLQRLADYTDQQYQMRRKIQQALIYPCMMVVVSLSIVGFLLEYIVPKMVAVYTSSKQTLPAPTQWLIALSDGLKNSGVYLLIAAIIGIGIFRYFLKKNVLLREKIHRFCLRLPVVGNAIKTINTARFSRTVAILSGAGISIIEAMTVSAQLVTNIPIQKAVTEATKHIREGTNIHFALKQTNFFPAMSIHLIASGESSGQLESMLERAANNQDNDITQLIETGLTLLEPAIILLMGAIVLFIVLAVLLPIFQLDQMM